MGYTIDFNAKELQALLAELPVTVIDVPSGTFNYKNYERGEVVTDYLITPTPIAAVIHYVKQRVAERANLPVFLYAPFYIRLASGEFGVTIALYFS